MIAPVKRAIVLFSAIVCGFVATNGSAGAAALEIKIDKERVRGGFLSEVTYRRLEQAQASIKKGEVSRGIEILERLARVTKEPFEKAVVLRTWGNVLIDQNDFEGSIPLFEEALRLDELTMPEVLSILYNLAQMSASLEKYEDTLAYLDLWRPLTPEVKPEAHLLAAAALSSLKRYKEAVAEIEAAIAKSPSEAPEQWYQLLFAMHVELKDYATAIEVLKTVVSKWPGNANYWKQLASLYTMTEQETKALAVYEVGIAGGLIATEADIKNVVSLYMFLDLPLKAALLLERTINEGLVKTTGENLEMLGNAWLRAQEPRKAIEAYRRSTDLKENAQIDLLAAQLLMEQQDWDAAVLALEHLTRSENYRSSLPNPGVVHVLMGSALFERGRLEEAKVAFRRGMEFPAVKNDCASWIDSIQAAEAARASAAEE